MSFRHFLYTALSCIVIPVLIHANSITTQEITTIPFKSGDLVPVTCLNRTIESGEHIVDSNGNLQYIPFPVCAETNQPLSLPYARNGPINCTIFLDDPLFHLFEFYIHADAPLTCRVPEFRASTAQLLASSGSGSGEAGSDAVDDGYARLNVALAGSLQRSHAHLGREVNVLVHMGEVEEKRVRKNKILAAGAYSSGARDKDIRIVIGDDITFMFDIRWIDGDKLPESFDSDTNGGTVIWVFGVIVGFLACFVWGKGWHIGHSKAVEFVKESIMGKKEVLPKYNGYGYGVASTNTSTGKRE